jgi:hypothetical protein
MNQRVLWRSTPGRLSGASWRALSAHASREPPGNLDADSVWQAQTPNAIKAATFIQRPFIVFRMLPQKPLGVFVAKGRAGNEIFETCRSYALRDQLVFIHDCFSGCRNDGQISLGQTSLPSPPGCRRKTRRQALRGRRARSEARVATMAALFVCGGYLSTPGASPHLPQEPRASENPSCGPKIIMNRSRFGFLCQRARPFWSPLAAFRDHRATPFPRQHDGR